MSNGFTLIELLVVVLIIGILSAVALPQYQGAVDKTRFTELVTVARTLYNAEKAYYMANGVYTSDLTALDVDLPAGAQLRNGTAEGQAYVLPNGNTFRVTTTGDSASVRAYNTTTLNNIFVIHFGWGRTFTDGETHCAARTKDASDRYNKLCKSLGGVRNSYNWDGGFSYTIP